jgi:hypothetical protein
MRRAPAIICFAVVLLSVLTASLCMASASSAATSYPALRYRVIKHESGYVVVRGYQRTLVVRSHQRYARGRDGLRYRVVKRTYGYLVLKRVSSRYGCAKPVTTSTVRNLSIRGGKHDVTYSHVRFEGRTGSSPSSWTVVRIGVGSSSAGSISNITFDHCVFATLPRGVFGNAVHMWSTSTTGKTIRNITFKHCWFEPQPRMVIEMNGRGGWWHDVTIDHCTFEAGGGQMLSFDMSPVSGDPVAPWGVKVDGVVRGVEGLHITNNDFRGTGVTVNGFTPRYTMGFEFGCVYPYAKDPSIGRSEFTGNRVARCASAWFQCNRNGARGMTFADNLFDYGYNPGGIPGSSSAVWAGTSINDCTFVNNTYVLDGSGLEGRPWDLLSDGLAGRGNTFAWEDWTKPAGRMASSEFPFTNATYTDCHFHLPVSVTFPASASGTGCVFQSGSSGGQFD